ncbi:Uncharacterised protein [Mycobacteroides abscessus subsp. abscessus]|nr:Uncharacterised protein [Mycobacteroides abscessus subsp. abscessus]
MTRPVTTTSAPERSASVMPQAPRYALADTGLMSPTGGVIAWRSPRRSSPST